MSRITKGDKYPVPVKQLSAFFSVVGTSFKNSVDYQSTFVSNINISFTFLSTKTTETPSKVTFNIP